MNAYGRIELGGRGRLLLAVPGVLIAAVIGVGLLTADQDESERVAPSPSLPVARIGPTVQPDPEPCRSAVFEQPAGRKLLPLYDDGRLAVMVALDLDDSWCHVGGFGVIWTASSDRHSGTIGFTVADGGIPCVDSSPGSGVAVQERDRAMVSIDGQRAQRIDLRAGSACHPSAVLDALGDQSGRGPESMLRIWLVDVGGSRLALYAVSADRDPAALAALSRTVESVSIGSFPAEPSSAEPSPWPHAIGRVPAD